MYPPKWYWGASLLVGPAAVGRKSSADHEKAGAERLPFQGSESSWSAKGLVVGGAGKMNNGAGEGFTGREGGRYQRRYHSKTNVNAEYRTWAIHGWVFSGCLPASLALPPAATFPP